jgi:hypothetical protein
MLKPALRPAWLRVRRLARLLRWAASALPSIAAGESARHQRLLLIYDFSSQSFSLGDILIFQEAALVLRTDLGLEKIDVALVYDPAAPVVPDPAFAHIEAEDFLFHLAAILPAAQVNPHLGSLLLFDSHRRLEAYIADNIDFYRVWPSLRQYAAKEYLFYYCFNELFRGHFARHGRLPAMQSRPAALDWANRFLAGHAGDAVAVTVQLRRNPANPKRNSNYDAWLAFFQQCAGRYAAKFIVICHHAEVDARLREHPNVIVAKDYGTALEQDLALLEAGALHMGAASGPGTIVQFNRKPYCMFNWDLNVDSIHGLIREDHRYRFEFSTPWQNWLFEGETEQLLMSEFQRLWAHVRDQGLAGA